MISLDISVRALVLTVYALVVPSLALQTLSSSPFSAEENRAELTIGLPNAGAPPTGGLNRRCHLDPLQYGHADRSDFLDRLSACERCLSGPPEVCHAEQVPRRVRYRQFNL